MCLGQEDVEVMHLVCTTPSILPDRFVNQHNVWKDEIAQNVIISLPICIPHTQSESTFTYLMNKF